MPGHHAYWHDVLPIHPACALIPFEPHWLRRR